ncbi:replication initiation protein RepM [Moraxella lacunata]|uniref:RepB family plasmid replication initiator protein n=1 Tax=Moraxella lacunata TaxID=477 RepID=A0A1V4GN15_MORLA|nr:replication initiation protein RepM [Moraxella lacunata]OPH34059.1 RepB family plasmid replication initiator protein [Moraxella lacunata]
MGSLVVKDNALIEASHRLGEVEQRLVLLAILKARNVGDTVEQLKDKMLTIHADDYITNFGGTRQGAYKALKQAVMGLFDAKWGYKYLTDKGEQRVRYERFTQSADYGEGEGTVKFMFSTAIIPMLVELERRFTSYEIEQVAQLSSSYAMRLYEFFMRHLDKKTGTGWLDISLDDLRFRFGLLPNEYKTMSNFKAYVLDFALKQINENTDLSATYTQKKQGRVIVGFHFEFKQKANAKPKKTKENTERDPNTKDIFDGLTDKEREVVANKTAYADQKGITDPLHRQNLINQGLEQHRQAEKAERERKEREKAKRQAQKAKEQADKLAKDEQERQEKERAEQRRISFIEMFESLDEQYQEQALDEVAKNFDNNIFSKWFKEAREQGVAHKDPKFIGKFYELFGW